MVKIMHNKSRKIIRSFINNDLCLYTCEYACVVENFDNLNIG